MRGSGGRRCRPPQEGTAVGATAGGAHGEAQGGGQAGSDECSCNDRGSSFNFAGKGLMSQEPILTNDLQQETSLRATQQLISQAREGLGTVIAGQGAAIDELLMCILCRGHVLLEGVPGIAKTLMVKTLGRLLGLGFQRVQATPDLMPADILGTTILKPGTDTFTFHAGPVFTDLLLVDEINR